MNRMLICLAILAAPLSATGQDSGTDRTERCEADENGAGCWLELDSHPGCDVWLPSSSANQSAVWTGQCEGGVAEGAGVLTLVSRFDPPVVYEAHISDGKLHGQAVIREANGIVRKGSYSRGIRTGHWTDLFADGEIRSGLIVDGRRAGTWIIREPDGDVTEIPYVNGRELGTEIRRFADGSVTEIPRVNDVKHGTEIQRDEDGRVIREIPYVNGVLHGTEIQRRYPDPASEIAPAGLIMETPWVNGERTGIWIARDWGGAVLQETHYVDGVKHGMEVIYNADGTVIEGRYVNGELQD